VCGEEQEYVWKKREHEVGTGTVVRARAADEMSVKT
jgi:hypothetical protein